MTSSLAVEAVAAELAVEPMEVESAVVAPAVAVEPAPMTVEPVVPAVVPAAKPAEQGKIPCPGCGKILRIRTLAEKHTCARKPRKSWRLDPDKLLAKRRAAAERRFISRQVKLAAA